MPRSSLRQSTSTVEPPAFTQVFAVGFDAAFIFLHADAMHDFVADREYQECPADTPNSSSNSFWRSGVDANKLLSKTVTRASRTENAGVSA